MLKFSEWTVEKIRKALETVKRNGQEDSLHVWYNPSKNKVFVSVGDWVDTDQWTNALAKVVGSSNIEGEPEASPSGEGWVLVRDTHRIKDSLGKLSPERKRILGLD